MEIAEQRAVVQPKLRHALELKRISAANGNGYNLRIYGKRCRKCVTLLKGRFNMCGADVREIVFCRHDNIGYIIAASLDQPYVYGYMNARRLEKYRKNYRPSKWTAVRYELKHGKQSVVAFDSFSTGGDPSAYYVAAKLYRNYEREKLHKLAEAKLARRQKTRSAGSLRDRGRTDKVRVSNS